MYGKLSASGPVPTRLSSPVPGSMLWVDAEKGFERTAATRNGLSGLTVIGITTFSALKRGPALSDPSDCSVYEPMSPSSAFETYTKVAATHWALKSSDESAMTKPALKFF